MNSLKNLDIRLSLVLHFHPGKMVLMKEITIAVILLYRNKMQEDIKIFLQDAVNMSSWTHNTKMNTLGFTLLLLVTEE